MGYRIEALTISTPEIVRHPTPTTARLNTTAELECSANGAVVFDWYKDDKPFRQINRTDGKLIIEKVTLKDGGMYHCVAIGGHGRKTTSQKAKLTVGTCVETPLFVFVLAGVTATEVCKLVELEDRSTCLYNSPLN